MEAPMPTQRLRALAAELHEELERTDSLDDEGTQLLRGVREEIHELIETSADQREPDGLLSRLRASIQRFEGTHPRLTEIAQRISDTLSQAGI
jgi:hypothetical protein